MRNLFLGWVLFSSMCLVAQDVELTYLVLFSDKANSPFSINNASEFLSERAIERRNKQNIDIIEQDLPVNESYVQELANLDLELSHRTKWFNGVIISTIDTPTLASILALPFVSDTILLNYSSVGKTSIDKFAESSTDTTILYNENYYGAAYNQLSMVNGEALHLNGYRGEGIRIAVLDAGFANSDQNIALEHIHNSGRIVATRDIVDSDDDVYHASGHGANVLSIMAGKVANSFVGTAPDAEYMLLITEDVSLEMPIEEINWLVGAEYADSTGADIVTTSLGYSTFDDARFNYAYENMDGDQAMITRAADIAASKGMLILNSAGNSGNSSWFYVTAPADGDSVLAVGAVTPLETVSSFSSRGPSFDGDVKPNVMAQGTSTALVNTQENIVGCNGTSYSCPVIAGMAACLWQSSPESSAIDVLNAIERSAHLFENPDIDYGYGIPNFQLARFLLQQQSGRLSNDIQAIAYPNPFQYNVNVYLYGQQDQDLEIKVTDSSGRIFEAFDFKVVAGEYYSFQISSLNDAIPGVYFLHLSNDDECKTIKLVKVEE